MVMVPSLVRSLSRNMEPPAGMSMTALAISGSPCTPMSWAENEALPPPLRTKVDGDNGVPEFVPPSWDVGAYVEQTRCRRPSRRWRS